MSSDEPDHSDLDETERKEILDEVKDRLNNLDLPDDSEDQPTITGSITLFRINQQPAWQAHDTAPPYLFNEGGHWVQKNLSVLENASSVEEVNEKEFTKAIWETTNEDYTEEQLEQFSGYRTFRYEGSIPVFEPVEFSRPWLYQGGDNWKRTDNRSRILENCIQTDDEAFLDDIRRYDDHLRNA